MGRMILDGKIVADRWIKELAARAKGKKIRLGCLLVGEDEPSVIYVRAKQKRAAEAGIGFDLIHMPEKTSQKALLGEIARLNADDGTSGMLVQLPLPPHMDKAAVIEAIDPEKDVDGFHPHNIGLLHAGVERIAAATPLGIIRLMEHYKIKIQGRRAAVVGASDIVGKPMAAMLLNRGATITIAHEGTKNLKEITREADILVAAAGKPKLIKGDFIKPGACVIDVGTNKVGGHLVGDVDYKAASEIAGAITPVPGGVGPMTIAALLENTINAWERRRVVRKV